MKEQEHGVAGQHDAAEVERVALELRAVRNEAIGVQYPVEDADRAEARFILTREARLVAALEAAETRLVHIAGPSDLVVAQFDPQMKREWWQREAISGVQAVREALSAHRASKSAPEPQAHAELRAALACLGQGIDVAPSTKRAVDAIVALVRRAIEARP